MGNAGGGGITPPPPVEERRQVLQENYNTGGRGSSKTANYLDQIKRDDEEIMEIIKIFKRWV